MKSLILLVLALSSLSAIGQDYLSHVELLDSTVQYYSKNDRSLTVEGRGEMYWQGKKDPVGRALLCPEGFNTTNEFYYVMDVVNFYVERDGHLGNSLKPEYGYIQYDFLTLLQRFHDLHGNWVKNPGPGWSLSDQGWKAYWMLRETAKGMDEYMAQYIREDIAG